MDILKDRYSLAVSIGAIFGALSRFYITEFFTTIFGKGFGFYGTLFVNVSGCLIIAYILTLSIENIRLISPELRLMTTTGFCGAYTTFSTYGLDATRLLETGNTIPFLLYWIGSSIAGTIAISIGVFLARSGFPKS
ncbi:fluoride efflux transporter CrcB [Pannus brasiliensis CCIBt3594]|uniref:Fluoride-specific ion channel FluC n=1 Tax=Pannus brasiliensis CCIBt3594 TaxID=1427578 RepID=A0AAW9QUU1_9CHRO